MTVPPLWPSSLPLCPDAVAEVTGAPADQLRKFQPQDGLPIQRPAQTAEMMRFRVSFAGLTGAQQDAFRAFRVDDLKLGALPFAWIHPQRVLVREVRMDGPPEWIRAGGHRWSLRFPIVFLDVTPAWVASVTTANGFMEAV